MEKKTANFSVENSQYIADSVIDLLNETSGSVKEKVYAISHVLHALGETLYDKDDFSRQAVETDYNSSPTWAAALMLVSYLPHDILKRLTEERDNKEDTDIE